MAQRVASLYAELSLKDNEFRRGLGAAQTELGKTGRSVQENGLKFTELSSKLSLAGMALKTVAGAAKFAYAQIEEGAQLELAADRFDKLSVSIGTTADSMLGSLTDATHGMVSNAELMTSASDIINLGLANNEVGVTRLATVISGLGLDMQQVILTFANNSKARLDALGLSVEGVTKKAAELEANGFKGDAFDEAVLISLEEKMSLFGDASETTAGQLAILKAEAKNAKDEVLLFLQSIAAPVIDSLAKSTSGYQQQLHQTALELAATTTNSEDLTRVINEQFGAGEDLFAQAEQMGLAYIDLGHGQSVWIEDLEKAAGISIPRFGQELAKLNQMAQEYTVVAGTSAVGATSEYSASLEELARMGHEAQQAQNALNREMNAMTVGALRDVESTIGDPIDQLLQAQQQLVNSQGEWVQATVTNAGRIGSINSELAADLSNEQANAMRDILRTVDEGSAEWLNAYNALQGDLTESQRQALIAQRAELEAAGDSTVSVYTGSIEDAEAAQTAIDEANQAIIDSYRELAFEGALALAELSPDPNAIQRTLDYAVAIGELTQEEADMRLQAAETRFAIEELNTQVVQGGLNADVAGIAFDLLASGQYRTVESAIAAAEKQQQLLDLIAEMPEDASTTINVDTGDAYDRLSGIRDLLNQVDGRHASASVSVNSMVDGGGPQGGGPAKGAGGGSKSGNDANHATGTDGWLTVPPGYPNDSYTVGLTSGEKYSVTNSSNGGGMGGIVINVYQQPGDSGETFANRVATIVSEKYGNLK